MYFQNVRGLRSKTDLFYTSISDCEFDFVCLVETGLCEGIDSAELFPDSYSVFRRDRDIVATGRERLGGALLGFRSELNVQRLDLSCFYDTVPFVDIVGCKFTIKSFNCYIFIVYIPPELNVQYVETFLELLEEICTDIDNVIVVGDFNCRNFNSDVNDLKCKILIQFMDLLDLSQLNTILNEDGRLLDLVMSNTACKVSRDYLPMVAEDRYHPSLIVDVPVNFSGTRSFCNNLDNRSYNFRKVNYFELYQSFLTCDWSFLYNFKNVDEACDQFYKKLYAILDAHVRFHTPNLNNNYPKWYTAEIVRNLKLKNRYFRSYKRTGGNDSLESYKQLRALSKTQIGIAYREYMQNIELKLCDDPSNFYSYVNSRRRQSRIPSELQDPTGEILDIPSDILNAFKDYFKSVYLPPSSVQPLPTNNDLPCIHLSAISESDVENSLKKLKNTFTAGHDKIPSFLVKDCASVLTKPLCYIFNLSIKSCQFPVLWKIAKICPVFKSGDNKLIKNYRPISILSNFAKVFEMSVYAQLYPMVSNLISPYQHGFVSGRSVATNLACFNHYVSTSFNGRGQVDAVYADFSKAFDTIDHGIVLSKLGMYGFSESSVSFFRSYLDARGQFVTYAGFSSDFFTPTSGVPQGSNLGPLIFLLFINDLCVGLKCERLMFADDLKVFCDIRDMGDCHRLQNDLNYIEEWCNTNGLNLNISKCYVLTYSLKTKNKILFEYQLNSATLPRCSKIRDLGVLYDERLAFTCHVESICSSALRSLGFINRQTKNFKNSLTLKSLYFCYVRSKLEYCAVIWDPHYAISRTAIEKVQRKFLKLMSFRIDGIYPPRGFEYDLMLNRFSIHSLEMRRNITNIVFLYNLLNNRIDCTTLLSAINFRIPFPNSRNVTLFSYVTPRNNIVFNSPVQRMCRYFNKLCNSSDIFFDSIACITKHATEEFLML